MAATAASRRTSRTGPGRQNSALGGRTRGRYRSKTQRKGGEKDKAQTAAKRRGDDESRWQRQRLTGDVAFRGPAAADLIGAPWRAGVIIVCQSIDRLAYVIYSTPGLRPRPRKLTSFTSRVTPLVGCRVLHLRLSLCGSHLSSTSSPSRHIIQSTPSPSGIVLISFANKTASPAWTPHRRRPGTPIPRVTAAPTEALDTHVPTASLPPASPVATSTL